MRNYPNVPVRTVTDCYFGREVRDPYRYLEDASSPETLAVVRAENDYTRAFFADRTDFSARALEAELRARKLDEEVFGVREAAGVICGMRKLEGGALDIVRLDEDFRVAEVVLNDEMLGNRMHFFDVAPCPTVPGLYAVMATIHGHRLSCVVVWDANQGKALAELDDAFQCQWSPDGNYIYYSDSEVDPANNVNINRARRYDWRANRLDTLYTREENAVCIEVTPGPDGGCFLMAMNDYSNMQVLWCDRDGGIVKLNDGVGSYDYIGETGGRCFFKTDAGAPMSRVVSLRREQLEAEGSLLNGYAVAVPEADAPLGAAGIAAGGLLTVHERDAASELSLYGLDGARLRGIELPDRFGSAKLSGAIHMSDRNRAFFNFESFVRKPSLYVIDGETLEVSRLRGDDADVSDIAVEQCFLNARDGQRILVYLVRPRDMKPTGDAPVLMFGYGGYAASMPPWAVDAVTEHNVVDWVRRGRIYAHCILRGGLEYGEEWHRAAMLDRKKNAFQDFIDIAEYLVASGWTKPGQIVATGKSNGGLLMAAIATMRPDLFGVVIASVPHTDMLRFRGDDRGMMYITEYGDPLGSAEMFDYMYSYSPYHNIRPGALYPWMYVQTGEMDNNVPPYHGKKFAVRLQHDADEAHPILLEVLAHGSHNRGVGDEYYRNIAQMQTFVELGLAAQK